LRLTARALALVVPVLVLAAAPASAQVSIPSLGTPLTEDFNTLASSVTSSVLPPGWAFAETGTNANATYSPGNGSAAAGDTYSFGSTGSTERALGGLQSGSLVPLFGASFVNDTGTTVTELAIAYTGEQWRMGTAGRVDRLDFQYSVNATGLNSAGAAWADVNALDFTAPTTAGAVGALDGNASANRATPSASIPVSLAPGATVWIRWIDLNAAGADDGLAVDDFSLTASVATTSPHTSGLTTRVTRAAGLLALPSLAR